MKRKLYLLLISFIALSSLLAVTSIYAKNDKNQTKPKPLKYLNYSIQTQENKKIIIIVPNEVNAYKEYPNYFFIPIYIFNLSESEKIDLKMIKATFGKEDISIPVNEDLEPIGKDVEYNDELPSIIEYAEKEELDEESTSLLQKGYFKQLQIDVKKKRLKDGQSIDFTFKAVFE